MAFRVACALLSLLSMISMAASKVAVISRGELSAPVNHGIATLEQALRSKGFTVVKDAAPAAYVFLAGSAPLRDGPRVALHPAQRVSRQAGHDCSGGDTQGLMFMPPSTQPIKSAWSAGAVPFQYVRASPKPYLAERGISMYTMQRAYFESRLYDEELLEAVFRYAGRRPHQQLRRHLRL